MTLMQAYMDREVLPLTVSYMDMVYRPDELNDTAAGYLQDVDYDTLVGTGLSGALVLPTLARHLGKHFLVVRKPGDGSHSYLDFEGHLGKRWLFVDDFIDTGKTFDRVYNAIQEVKYTRDFVTELAGAFMYSSSRPYRTPAQMLETLKEYQADFAYDPDH